MKSPSPLTSFPDVLQIGTEWEPVLYAKQPQLYAVHGPLPSHLRTTVELVLENDALTICRGTPAASADLLASSTITPVYRVTPQGPLAVPTGRIFIRCRPGTSIETHRAHFASLGFTIVEIPSYAPHTAWIQATTGDAAASLRNFGRLKTLPDIEHAEPQLLTQRSTR